MSIRRMLHEQHYLQALQKTNYEYLFEEMKGIRCDGKKYKLYSQCKLLYKGKFVVGKNAVNKSSSN